CSETCSQYSSPNFLSPYLMRGWNGFGTESQKLFFAGVIRRATQAFAGLRGWHRPRERALARGVNKKHFSGTAEAGALPKSQPSVCPAIRSAWTGQRPVPTQPLETRPYTGKIASDAGRTPRVRLRSLSRVGSERPISHFSQKRREMGHPGCTPARCFREKHAEPKAQGVIVSSLQDSVVAYLYPALTRWAGIFRSYGAEMREVGHSPEG